MPTPDRVSANAHAHAARQAIEQVQQPAGSNADLLGLATAEALLAIFHQLKHMEGASITLKGAADLADAMDVLSRRLPDR